MGKKVKFHQWPSCHGCECILPRVVYIRRLMNIGGIAFDVYTHGFTKQVANLNYELHSYIYRLPVIEADEKRYKGENACIDFILKQESSNNLNYLFKSSSTQSIIYRQWANDSLLASLNYARWKNEENFYNFSQGIKWPKDVDDSEHKTDAVRSYILSRYQGHYIFDMDEESFKNNLIAQLGALESLLHKKFIEPLNEKVTLTDLNIFVVLQGLLSPDLLESRWIRDRFENIMNWYNLCDTTL